MAMDTSPLSKLSPELRNDIYHEVLLRDDAIEFVASSLFRRYSCRYTCTSKHPREWLALTLTCKQLWRETYGLLFTINSFEILDPWYGITNTAPSQTVRSFLHGVVTQSARAAAKSITLNLGRLESANGETLIPGAVMDLKRNKLAAYPPETCVPLRLKFDFVVGYSLGPFGLCETFEIDLQDLAASIGGALERVEELHQETLNGNNAHRYQRLKELVTLKGELRACLE